MKKYRLTNETIEVEGHTLHRIEAVRDFGDVKAGDKGGYIESERNLSHNGECWIYGEARVFGAAKVSGAARVSDAAWVGGAARVSGRSLVDGNAIIRGEADVCGSSCIVEGEFTCGKFKNYRNREYQYIQQ